MKLNLATKKILIIDDFAGMRKAIKNMLGTLDAHFVVGADNGEAALRELSREKFDIVLCDYNLGEGKNGQQVLEEARLNKTLPFQAIFIMISSEQTPSMVLGAMENKPDEYLAKPFNAQQLLSRLQKNFDRKTFFFSIEREINRGNLALAIQYCDKLLQQNSKNMRMLTLKLRAELALKVGDYNKANEIYQGVLDERELPWAKQGLGIVAFKQKQFDEAAAIFEENINLNPLFLESYDWLSQTYLAQELPLQAQDILNQAVDISPNSLLRQKKLADTADKNNNIEVAEQAYKSAVKLGKYSVHKSSNDFAKLAKLYTRSGNNTAALKTLDDMRQEYRNNPEAELRAVALETELYQNLGDEKLAKESFEKVKNLSADLGRSIPKDLQLDVAKTCLMNDDQTTADKVLGSLITSHIDDDEFIDNIRAMQREIGLENHSETLIQKTKQELMKINNQGVSLFREGKLQEAMKIFEHAIARMPENKTIILNMARIALHELKLSGPNEDRVLRASTFIKKAEQAGVSGEKLNNIKLEFSRLTQSRPGKKTNAA
jgi:tetratricopeptide (TPR) repeat protein